MKGSIRRRGSTLTAYWDTIDPATGARVQHSKGGFKTNKTAQAHLNIVIGKVEEGTWRPDKPMTVKELLNDHWLPAKTAQGLRPTTLAQYRHVIDHWLLPNIGSVRVASLTPAHVTGLVEKLRNAKSAKGRDGLSARSAQLSVSVLKSACAWGFENSLFSRNPVAGVRRPRANVTSRRVWTPTETRTFLATAKNDRLAVAWVLLLTRGLRRGEVCGLRWADIDLDGKVFSITRTRVVVDGKAIDSEPKTQAGKRSVPLDDQLVAVLRSHRARQAEEHLAAGAAYEDGGHLLADELGHPYHPDTISQWFDDKVMASGLPRIRLHDTRHTAASHLLASGVPVNVVADLLGHASPTITLQIYAHVLPGMAEKAGEQLSALVLS